MGLLTVPFAIGLVFLGCCTNVVFLELIIREEPGAGNIITFFQFLFIAVEGFFFVSQCCQKPSKIPMKSYMVLVGLYFTVSVINNLAFKFDIPLPLHMIFRAGSLIANMALGIILLKRQYPKSKYVAVMMITIGISMATIASAQQASNGAPVEDTHLADGDKKWNKGSYDLVSMMLGIALLLFALFTSARMGIYQEVLYKEHGKYPREAMFYTHALPLPGFLIFAPNIWNQMLVFSASDPISFGGVGVPKLWLYILGNCITQYVCIRGVFVLTTECPSLIVTLVVTLRKFVSLLFSIFYFQNPFTFQHWIATALVFGGTALFTGIFNPILNLIFPPSSDRSESIKVRPSLADGQVKTSKQD